MILPTSTRVHRLALYLIELSKMTVHRLVPLTLLHTAHKILFLFRFKPSCRKPGFISPKKKKKNPSSSPLRGQHDAHHYGRTGHSPPLSTSSWHKLCVGCLYQHHPQGLLKAKLLGCIPGHSVSLSRTLPF